MPSAATWMNLEMIILSEVSQTDKKEGMALDILTSYTYATIF